jgi:hypothetical protein
MKNYRWKVATTVAVAVASLGLPEWAAADQVVGRITRTYVLVEDTDLIGDVACDVENAPCFSFGASGIELRLNGFSITGKADAATGCGGAQVPAESGITTNGSNGAVVSGPGVVKQFRGRGVLVTGSTDARVQGLIVSTTCSLGILVSANSFGTIVEGNVAVRNGSSAPGASCGGI